MGRGCTSSRAKLEAAATFILDAQRRRLGKPPEWPEKEIGRTSGREGDTYREPLRTPLRYWSRFECFMPSEGSKKL